jgi:hypothetical protein
MPEVDLLHCCSFFSCSSFVLVLDFSAGRFADDDNNLACTVLAMAFTSSGKNECAAAVFVFYKQKEHMKNKLITLTLAVGMFVGCGGYAIAHEEEERGSDDQRHNGYNRFERRDDRLGYELDHLNRMFDHVQGEMQRRGADRHMWQEYRHLRAEARQLNWRFRRGEQYYNRRDLRDQIEHMHEELHHLEEEMHIPQQAWYHWR